jgi:hypothetical protein
MQAFWFGLPGSIKRRSTPLASIGDALAAPIRRQLLSV